MKFVQAIKFFADMAHGTTGGRTGCQKCQCLIKNEDYETRRMTNDKCGNCGHYYYLHDQYL